MKWKSWHPAKVGDKRVKAFFALFPVKIGNDYRWLERVTVEFQLKMTMYNVFWKNVFIRKEPYYYWEKLRFIDTPSVNL